MTVRQGDTHAVYWQVLDDGSPIDLTGMTAEIHLRPAKGGTALELPAVVDAIEQRIKHTLTGALVPGTYLLEIELTKDGVIATAPTAANDTLTVVAQIA
jgi:hypothetical protein